jgi:phosphatidylglycerophosphate synthase
MNFETKTVLCLNLILFSGFFSFLFFVFPGRPLSLETKKRSRSFISNAAFREYWYFLSKPLVSVFCKYNISPNFLTFIGFLFSLNAGVLFSLGFLGLGGWSVGLSATFDVLDGLVAREKKISTKSGAFFDSVLDRLGESAIFLGLAIFWRENNVGIFVCFLVLIASQMVSYIRARGEGLGFFSDTGFMQRAERIILLGLGTVFAPLIDFSNLPFSGSDFALVFLTLIATGSIQTAMTRFFGTYKAIIHSEKKTELQSVVLWLVLVQGILY